MLVDFVILFPWILLKLYTVENTLVNAIFDDNKVFVKTKRGYVKSKIKTGLQSDTRAQVTSGLLENEEVVVEPTLVLEQTKSRFPFGFFTQ